MMITLNVDVDVENIENEIAKKIANEVKEKVLNETTEIVLKRIFLRPNYERLLKSVIDGVERNIIDDISRAIRWEKGKQFYELCEKAAKEAISYEKDFALKRVADRLFNSICYSNKAKTEIAKRIIELSEKSEESMGE